MNNSENYKFNQFKPEQSSTTEQKPTKEQKNNNRVWDFFDKNLKTLIITFLIIIAIIIIGVISLMMINKPEPGESENVGMLKQIYSYFKGGVKNKNTKDIENDISDLENQLDEDDSPKHQQRKMQPIQPDRSRYFEEPEQEKVAQSLDDLEDDSHLIDL